MLTALEESAANDPRPQWVTSTAVEKCENEAGSQKIYPAKGCGQLQDLRFSSPLRHRSPRSNTSCSPQSRDERHDS